MALIHGTATMGFDLSNPSTGLGQVLSALVANKPYLDAFKAKYGMPVGVTVTLDNGVVGHFTADGLFNVDPRTPPVFSISPHADADPSNVGPFVPPPPPGAPGGYPAAASQTPSAGGVPAPPKTLFGLPPLVLAGAGGLLIFLIARRL
jgi:hypothetical protein